MALHGVASRAWAHETLVIDRSHTEMVQWRQCMEVSDQG